VTDPASRKTGKLPFKAPKLEVYGRARDITRNIGSKGATDGGTGQAAGPKTSAG
jgi:hypothetical protein